MLADVIGGLIMSDFGLVATAYIINNSSKLNLFWSIPVFLWGFLVLVSGFRTSSFN